MFQGIYKITNTVNGKVYIGQSVNIESRFSAHRSDYKNENHILFNIKLYKAFRKYGLENFKFEILEETSQNLTEREQYYIDYYNSIENGYNSIDAVEPLKGEKNPNAKLTTKEVLEIYELLKNTDMLAREIAEKYGVCRTHIHRLNNGSIFAQEGYEYPIRTKTQFARPGNANGRGKLEDEDVLQIRLRYSKGEDVRTIYKDYENIYSYSGFKKVVQGPSYDHIPVYKKLRGEWVLNNVVVPVETISFVGE